MDYKILPPLKYVTKADDDMLVNKFKLIPHLDEVFQENKNLKFFCKISKIKTFEVDNNCPKWSIKHSTRRHGQRSKCFFPKYCSGPMNNYTSKLLLLVYNQTFYTPIVTPAEDVWVTGILPLNMNVSYNHFN